MSKQDKDFWENGLSGDIAPENYAAEGVKGSMLHATVPACLDSKSEQSRRFNEWLDRAIPLLQQYLTGHTTVAVTSPDTKPKH